MKIERTSCACSTCAWRNIAAGLQEKLDAYEAEKAAAELKPKTTVEIDVLEAELLARVVEIGERWSVGGPLATFTPEERMRLHAFTTRWRSKDKEQT